MRDYSTKPHKPCSLCVYLTRTRLWHPAFDEPAPDDIAFHIGRSFKEQVPSLSLDHDCVTVALTSRLCREGRPDVDHTVDLIGNAVFPDQRPWEHHTIRIELRIDANIGLVIRTVFHSVSSAAC